MISLATLGGNDHPIFWDLAQGLYSQATSLDTPLNAQGCTSQHHKPSNFKEPITMEHTIFVLRFLSWSLSEQITSLSHCSKPSIKTC